MSKYGDVDKDQTGRSKSAQHRGCVNNGVQKHTVKRMKIVQGYAWIHSKITERGCPITWGGTIEQVHRLLWSKHTNPNISSLIVVKWLHFQTKNRACTKAETQQTCSLKSIISLAPWLLHPLQHRCREWGDIKHQLMIEHMAKIQVMTDLLCCQQRRAVHHNMDRWEEHFHRRDSRLTWVPITQASCKIELGSK